MVSTNYEAPHYTILPVIKQWQHMVQFTVGVLKILEKLQLQLLCYAEDEYSTFLQKQLTNYNVQYPSST
jgi:hypothetical protein